MSFNIRPQRVAAVALATRVADLLRLGLLLQRLGLRLQLVEQQQLLRVDLLPAPAKQLVLQISDLRFEILDLRVALGELLGLLCDTLFVLRDALITFDHLVMRIQHQLLEGVDVVGEFADRHAIVVRDFACQPRILRGIPYANAGRFQARNQAV